MVLNKVLAICYAPYQLTMVLKTLFYYYSLQGTHFILTDCLVSIKYQKLKDKKSTHLEN